MASSVCKHITNTAIHKPLQFPKRSILSLPQSLSLEKLFALTIHSLYTYCFCDIYDSQQL